MGDTERRKEIKENLFKQKLKKIISLNDKQKSDQLERQMYYQGIQYAEDNIPYEEIEASGLNNEVSFMKGYNETIDQKGKSR